MGNQLVYTRSERGTPSAGVSKNLRSATLALREGTYSASVLAGREAGVRGEGDSGVGMKVGVGGDDGVGMTVSVGGDEGVGIGVGVDAGVGVTVTTAVIRAAVSVGVGD